GGSLWSTRPAARPRRRSPPARDPPDNQGASIQSLGTGIFFAKARFERAPWDRVVTSALWRGAARRERGAGRLRPSAYGPVRRLLPGATGSAPLPAKILPPRGNKSTSVVFTTQGARPNGWARGGPSEHCDAPSADRLPRPDEVPSGLCGRTAGRIRRCRLRPGA